MKVKPRLIIGLGNPGKEYEKTYHNVGFLAIDFFAKNPSTSNFQCLIPKPLKTGVYMNQSGNFVKAALKKYKAKPEELLIIHDDSDIELGKYKISFDRSSAGHNGIESIIKALGTKKFWRLRIGIRHGLTRTSRGLARKKAGELVLKKITKEDLEILNNIFGKYQKHYDFLRCAQQDSNLRPSA